MRPTLEPPGKTNLDARWRLSSLADAWKMRAMSAVRLCVARLAPLGALAPLSLIAGCTKQTPLYCETVDGCDENHGYGPGFYCDMKIHTCKTGNTAVDATDAASTGDAAGDKPTDGGTGEDHPSGTGDASDGSPDVLHGCV